MAKVVALRESIHLLVEKRTSKVLIESDFQSLVWCMNAFSSDMSLVGLIIQDCKLLLSQIPDCKLSNS